MFYVLKVLVVLDVVLDAGYDVVKADGAHRIKSEHISSYPVPYPPCVILVYLEQLQERVDISADGVLEVLLEEFFMCVVHITIPLCVRNHRHDSLSYQVLQLRLKKSLEL